MNQILKLVHH